MKFKKHLSFVACAEQARRNLENKHRRGARDAISPGPSSWIFKLNIKPVAKSPCTFEFRMWSISKILQEFEDQTRIDSNKYIEFIQNVRISNS